MKLCKLAIAVDGASIVLPYPLPRDDAQVVSKTLEALGAVTWFLPIEDSQPYMAVLTPITTQLASTEDAENDRLYEKWNDQDHARGATP